MAAPGPVPALPDTERRTQYAITASVGPLNVGFAIYGDSTDFTDWIGVYVNGVVTTAYTLTSPSGAIGTLARPITDAQITFSVVQTGTVQIVGARRPRRTSQFTENRGVAARDANQVITDLVAQNRETWDRFNRVIQGVPGDTFAPLVPATRANNILGFDASGNLALLPLGPTVSLTAGSMFNTRGLAAAATISNTVAFVQTAGFATVGDGGGALYERASNLVPGGFQSADGAFWQLFGPVVFPEQCGALGSGNDAPQLQDAISAAIALGAELKLRALYSQSTRLEITNAIKITGVGALTGFRPLPNIGSLLVNCPQAVVMRDFSILYPSQADAGTKAIEVTCPGASQNGTGSGGSLFENINIQIAYIGIDFIKAATWIVRGCTIKVAGIGIGVQNTNEIDIGDAAIEGNTNISAVGGIAIYQQSSGGLKINNTKVNGAHFGYELNLASGANTGVLLINDSSFEGIDDTGASIVLQRQGTTGGFGVVKIADSELSGRYGILAPADAAGVWLVGLSAIDNTFLGLPSALSVFMSVDSIRGFVAQGNNIYSVAAGSVQGFATGAAADRGLIGPNLVWGTVVANGIASTNTTQVAPT